MSGKARHNAPAIGYDACIRAFVPYAREDGRMFTTAGCPSHIFFVLVRRAADTSNNLARHAQTAAGDINIDFDSGAAGTITAELRKV